MNAMEREGNQRTAFLLGVGCGLLLGALILFLLNH